jgi:hypothetical protein
LRTFLFSLNIVLLSKSIQAAKLLVFQIIKRIIYFGQTVLVQLNIGHKVQHLLL